MATQAKIAIRAVRTIFGTPVPRQEVPEKAGLVSKKGALCYATAAGYLDECGADPALILGVQTQDGQNGANAGDKKQIVELAAPGVLFRGYLDTSAAEGTGVTAQTDLFKGYGVAKAAAGGVWFVDKGDAANDRVTIWEFWNGDGQAVGDIRHHVLFGFLFANFQGNIGT